MGNLQKDSRFSMTPEEIWADRKVSLYGKLVFGFLAYQWALAGRPDGERKPWISVGLRRIVDGTDTSLESVRRGIMNLVERGYIDVVKPKKAGGRDAYILRFSLFGWTGVRNGPGSVKVAGRKKEDV